jgi:ClpP class serine protease
MFSKLKQTLLGKGAARAPVHEEPFSGPAFDHHDPKNFASNGAYASDDIVRQFQHDRNSHAIGLIHRHQTDRESWEQWFFDAMIGEHHLQDFMAAISRVPPDARLDIILHSVGGFPLFVKQIARAIKAHKGETTIFIPHYAHHFATLIALAGNRVVMGPAATLSFIEPADGTLSQVIRQKGVKRAQDLTIMRLTMARNFGRELRAFVGEMIEGTAPAKLVKELIGGKRAPWDPLTATDARKMGLNVSTDMPAELYRLLQACRAAPSRDQGVRTVERTISAKSASLMNATDLETCIMHGVTLPPLDPSERTMRPGTRAPQVSHDEDDDAEDAHGVSLESCDITLRPLIAKMEQARGSRVVCIIHQAGMESNSVDTVTVEDVLTALQSTPADKPLDIILHTPGGYSYQAHQIALAVKAHHGRKTVFVPYFAMSGGTIISLAADEIVMAPHAVIGPIDSQFPVFHLRRMMPSRAVLDLVNTKPSSRINDELVELGIECKRSVPQDHKGAVGLMKGTYSQAVSDRVVHTLNDGTLTHGFPVTLSHARKLGLNVSGSLPPEATDIVRAYRRGRWGKRSVVFCG